MSDDERDSRVEQPLSAAPAASGQTAPASPASIPELVDAEPSAGLPRPTAKGKGKAKTKAKGKASPAMKRVADVLDKDTLSEHIAMLREEQAAAKEKRAKLARELKNTERRKSRLRKRARLLTDEDLLQVLMLRKGMRDISDDDSGAIQNPTSAPSGLTDAERPASAAEPSACS